MNVEYTGKRFVISVLLAILALMSTLATFGYIIDPNAYYRMPKYKTYLSEAFTTAGLIKNYPAEIAVIGSSMMQNTNMDLVREIFKQEPVKYTRSGMNIDEIKMLINRATFSTENKVEKFIVNIDMTAFNTEHNPSENKYPMYLYDDSKINDIKYLLGFETWTRFIPFDFFYNVLDEIDHPLSEKIVSKFANTTDLNLIGNWSYGTEFGEEIVKDKYKKNLEAVSAQDLDGMFERMKTRFDQDFFPTFKDNQNKEFILILPPYSALMWYVSEEKGYADILYDFKKYMVTRFSELGNVAIYDFQDLEAIKDLNNYKDTTHYSPRLNNFMIESIGQSEFIINETNVDNRINNLKRLELEFRSNNLDWLMK